MKILKWRGEGGGGSESFGGRPVNPLPIQHSDSDWKNGNVCQTPPGLLSNLLKQFGCSLGVVMINFGLSVVI